MLLYFARHGESEANLKRTFSNRRLPHHLTPLGAEQSRQLGLKLRAYGVDGIWCSPVPRAVETASIVGEVLNLTPRVAQALREFDVGCYEGTSSQAGWDEYELVLRSWLEGNHERRVGGGESLGEIVHRLRGFLAELVSDSQHERAALIGHGGLFRMALPHIFDNVTPHFADANTLRHVQLIVAETLGQGFTCRVWGGESLARPVEMPDIRKP